jgi:hypothetical protein
MNKAHSGLYALAEIYYTPCKLLVKTAWSHYRFTVKFVNGAVVKSGMLSHLLVVLFQAAYAVMDVMERHWSPCFDFRTAALLTVNWKIWTRKLNGCSALPDLDAERLIFEVLAASNVDEGQRSSGCGESLTPLEIVWSRIQFLLRHSETAKLLRVTKARPGNKSGNVGLICL